jgi:hypothetical protein
VSEVNVFVKKTKALPGQAPLSPRTPFDGRVGFFGTVTETHPESNTVNVRMDSGREVSNVRVASFQWVTVDEDKGYLTGQRHLPPVDTLVYCLMPSGEPSSALVLCSVFAYEDPRHAEFKEDSEDAAFTEKIVDSGGWAFIHDTRTGTRKIRNAPAEGDETVSLEVNQEEEGKHKITLKIYENTFEFDAEKQGVTETIKGDVKIEAGGDLSFKSSKSGLLEMGNAAATLGAMISDLLQALISFKSVGSPASHTAPDLTAAATQIKAKWEQVFKK